MDHSSSFNNNVNNSLLQSTRKDQASELPCRFKKGEIKIKCEQYPDEYIVKVCTTDPEKPKLMCLECIMDNPDYVKNHKKSIVPIERYLSDTVDKFEEMRTNKNAKLDSMPKNIKDFYDNYYRIRDTFKDCIDSERTQVTGIFKETIENIVDCFVDAGNTLKDSLGNQLTSFEANTEHLRNIIDQNYKLSGIPSENEVLKSANSKQGKVLEEYLSGLEKLKNSEKETAYESAYDIMYNQIHENKKNPPKFEIKESTKRKLEEIQEDLQIRLEEIVEEIKESIETNQVNDISSLSLLEARRDISNDGLCAFMEFENDHKKVSFKLHKKIPTKHNSNITCILNLGNKFIATGSRNGSIQVYQISTSQLVAELEEHTDVVTCLCALNNIFDNKSLILCSGSANLDGRILIWNVFEQTTSSVKLKGHTGNITAITSLGDGRTLASTAHDGNIVLWDTLTGEEIFKILAHSSMVTALRYSLSKKCLFSAGWDSNIKIWSVVSAGVNDGYVKKTLNLEKVILSETPIINILMRQVKGNYVVSIGANNTIQVWNTETGELEGSFVSVDNTRAEVCLLENKFKYGKADFTTLNTAVKEDIVGQTGTNESFYKSSASFENRNGYEMSSFFTQPRVQIVQNNKHQLRLVKAVNTGLGDGLGSVLNVYDIV